MPDAATVHERILPGVVIEDQYSSLIERLLSEQQQLTAVEQFSQSYDHAGTLPEVSHYRQLLPAAPPSKGQQYAFEVDLDRCSGCKACVTACHSLNGLDADETWRDVGLLVGGTSSLPVLQHVTTACHHCLEPACLVACPVNAYEKSPLTGIVKHLDDQCFGCQYCILACPYEVPKYHASKGIVRKCDMCSARLAVGEAPACVQACPSQAIAIRVVSIESVIEDAEAALFLPAAPDPQITYPTTTYKSQRVLPRNMLPADYFQVSRQHPHWPLVVMLVLTQLSVGAFAWGIVLERFVSDGFSEAVRPLLATMALVFGLLALTASVFHLGRPLYAFRAVLGLRHSWLSREIVVFGLFAALACLYAGAAVVPSTWPLPPDLIHILAWGVVVVGALAVFCSVMIYASLRREFWDFPRTAVRFALTSIWLGLATLWFSLAALSVVQPSETSALIVDAVGPTICWTLMIAAGAKLAWEAMLFRHLLSRAMTPRKRSALLMTRDLASAAVARFALGALGGIFAPALLLRHFSADNLDIGEIELTITTVLLFGTSLTGELLERYLFFAAVAAPRMPGGVR
ncbi:MAG: DmsC/YnfH family molybdoenzyme membrane anchor subunit [Pirellulales bacterium]